MRLKIRIIKDCSSSNFTYIEIDILEYNHEYIELKLTNSNLAASKIFDEELKKIIQDFLKSIPHNIYRIQGKSNVYKTLNFLLFNSEIQAPEILEHNKTRSNLVTLKNAILSTFLAPKHKKNFPLQWKEKQLDPTRQATVAIYTSRNKRYVVRSINPTQVDLRNNSATAFAAQVARLALGTGHTPSVRCVFDTEACEPNQTRSRFMDGLETFNSLFERKIFPSHDELIEAGFIETLAASYLFADYDLHPSNIGLNKLRNISIFDFNNWFFPKTCSHFGFSPYTACHPSNDIPAPKKAFPITRKDLKNFPFLSDAKPFWWLLRKNSDPNYVNYVYPYLEGIEKNSKVRPRVFKFFLRMILMDQSIFEEFARSHFTDLREGKEYVDFVMDRIKLLKNELFLLDEFHDFIEKNPNVFNEIIIDLQAYNDSFKPKNHNFRVDIEKVKSKIVNFPEKLQQETKDSLTKNTEELQKLYADVKGQLDTLPRDFYKPADLLSYQSEITDIVSDTKRWPKNVTLDVLMTKIDTTKEKLSRLDIECKNRSSAIKLVNKISELHRYINYIYKFYIHCESFPARHRIQELMDKIEALKSRLDSKNIIPMSESIGKEIETGLNDFTEYLFKNDYSASIFTKQAQYEKYETLIAGIQTLLEMSESGIKANSAHKFFLRPHHHWHAYHIIEQCEKLIIEPKSATKINNLKQTLLAFLAKYLKLNIEVLSFKRIATISRIFTTIRDHDTYESLSDKLQTILSNIEYSFLESRELSQTISAALTSYLKTNKAPSPELKF